MAQSHQKPNVPKLQQQRSASKDERSYPRGIRKERSYLSSRKTASLRVRLQRAASRGANTEPKHPLPSPTISTPDKADLSTPLQDKSRKRKRGRETKSTPALSKCLRKRPRTNLVSSVGPDASQSATAAVTSIHSKSVAYWVKKGGWPKEYFDQDGQTRRDIEQDSWFEKYWEPEENMSHLLARKKSSLSFRAKRSEASSITPSSTTPSDQRPRDIKSAPYQDVRYESLLATKGSFMGKSELGVKDTSKIHCRTLLENEQTFPGDSLFHDDLFEKVCEIVRNKNEARVVRDISPLIVPSAETLAIRGIKQLKILVESVNEGWNNSIPLTKTRPQPDYSVGFRREAFTEDQLKRLEPFVGDLTDTSFFMATYYIYFPFLTCEVKCGTAALDIADRQNAHSMTMAVRGVVELFRLVKREKELHREILAFSVSHDHRTVRIYGHYPIINGNETTFFRHPIREFSFTELDGKEKWTAYKFTKNVYDIWMPMHFKRICSVIDALPPDINFEVSQQSETAESGLSQGLESHRLFEQSSRDAASLLEDVDNQSSRATSSRDITPDTSLSQRPQGAIEKRRKRGRPVELHQSRDDD